MAEASDAVHQTRNSLVAALLRAGTLCIGNLDGSTPESLAETDRALTEARFRGIVLNELLIEEGNDA